MSCLFLHDWEQTDKFFTQAVKSNYFRSKEIDVAIIIEECKHCGKERAYYQSVTGERLGSLDVDFARSL